MERREIKEYYVREIKEYHVRVRGKIPGFMPLRFPVFRIEIAAVTIPLKRSDLPFIVPSVLSAGNALRLARLDYKMISVLGKCATTVAHLKRCPSAAMIEAETGGCEQNRKSRPSCAKIAVRKSHCTSLATKACR
jgi:hypothetical protein